MNRDNGWNEPAGRHCLLDPNDHVITGAVVVIAKVVIEAYVRDAAGFDQTDDIFRPAGTDPAVGDWAFIVEVDFHGARVVSGLFHFRDLQIATDLECKKIVDLAMSRDRR